MVTMRNLPKTKSAKYGYDDIICWDLVALTVTRGYPPTSVHIRNKYPCYLDVLDDKNVNHVFLFRTTATKWKTQLTSVLIKMVLS